MALFDANTMTTDRRPPTLWIDTLRQPIDPKHVQYAADLVHRGLLSPQGDTLCSIDGCGALDDYNGLCFTHYELSLLPQDNCKLCGVVLDMADTSDLPNYATPMNVDPLGLCDVCERLYDSFTIFPTVNELLTEQLGKGNRHRHRRWPSRPKLRC